MATKMEKHVRAQADSLLLELDVWGNGLNVVPRGARVSVGLSWSPTIPDGLSFILPALQCGDLLYRYMLNAYILGEVGLIDDSERHFRCILTRPHAQILDKPSSSTRIVAAIDYCLELCSEASAMRMTVMLVWPLLICGTLCLPPVREKVTGLLDAFAWDYCDDLKAAVSSELDLGGSQVYSYYPCK
jgi:hypothetical protein